MSVSTGGYIAPELVRDGACAHPAVEFYAAATVMAYLRTGRDPVQARPVFGPMRTTRGLCPSDMGLGAPGRGSAGGGGGPGPGGAPGGGGAG